MKLSDWESGYLQARRFLWLRKRRIDFFHFKKNDRVLDLGCGDGTNSILLSEIGITHIIGVDPSQNLIRKAKQRSSHIPFVIGSAEILPFKPGTFDVVFVDSVFHHISSYQRVLKEIKRILIPSGRLYFIEPHQSLFRKALDSFTLRKISMVFPYFRNRRRTYLEEKDKMDRWLSSEELFLDSLKKYGFKKIFLKHDLLSTVAEFILDS